MRPACTYKLLVSITFCSLHKSTFAGKCSSSVVVGVFCVCCSAEKSATGMFNFLSIFLLCKTTELFVAYRCMDSSNVPFSSCVRDELVLDIRCCQSSSVAIPFLRFVSIFRKSTWDRLAPC